MPLAAGFFARAAPFRGAVLFLGGSPLRQPYITTRHLTLISALSAAGGITSTYINLIGDTFQAALGFAGSTQWAAGLHVLWLVLASALTGRMGAATAAGLLKGLVELFTGNTHGVLVLLINLVAGLIVDILFALGRGKFNWQTACLAGGLASASNVFIFQLFSFLPADRLVWQGMLILGSVAFFSGALFAGLLALAVLAGLAKAGLARQDVAAPLPGKKILLFAGTILLVVFVALGAYIWTRVSGQGQVRIEGALRAPYSYDGRGFGIISGSGTLNGAERSFEGVPLKAALEKGEPLSQSGLVILTASDGYAFMVSMDEVNENANLLLVETNAGNKRIFNVMGAYSSKAWVRGLASISLVPPASLPLRGALDQPRDFVPQEWQAEMDSFFITFTDGNVKTQGVPLTVLLTSMRPVKGARELVAESAVRQLTIPLDDVLADEKIRLFTVIKNDDVRFAIARESGEVLLDAVTSIEVR